MLLEKSTFQYPIHFILHALKEEFEDTKGAIRNRISKKNKQHNGQKKMYKRTNNDRQNIHIKLSIKHQYSKESILKSEIVRNPYIFDFFLIYP